MLCELRYLHDLCDIYKGMPVALLDIDDIRPNLCCEILDQ